MGIVFGIGVILVVGYFFGLIAEKFDLPRVTAYLLSGVLFSENLLGHLVNIHFNSWSEFLVEICLGLIAFIIGSKIKFSEIKANGKTVILGTFFESLLPILFVFMGFYYLGVFFNIDSRIAIVLASVASTTAPAATVAIIEQYQSKGKFTNLLMQIVALDDAMGIIFFTLMTSFYFGESFNSGVVEIGQILIWSLSIGSFLGICLSKFAHLSKSDDYLFPLLLGLILIVEGMNGHFPFSPLLTCIILGSVSSNSFKTNQNISLILPLRHIEEFVFIIFFTMAGTQFSISYFKIASPFILAYVFLRGIGKYLGANIGTRLGGVQDKRIPKWLGLSLLPQAGVAIGLIFQVTHHEGLNGIKPMLINIILGSTIIYEIIGPLCSKIALKKSGDISIPT